MNEIILDWETFGVMLDKLIEQVEHLKFDGVFGIPKGGLPIAVAVANHMNIPLLLQPTKSSLVVDDISDTGKTLESHKNKIIATLYSTKWTTVVPSFYIAEKKSKDDWITFPWETK